MNVAVLGLWHLGSVTAACVSAAGHAVTAWDPNPDAVARLAAGIPPVAEPGLESLVRQEVRTGRLRPTTDLAEAVGNADVVWITFDTPVDDQDRADVDFVLAQVRAAFPHLPSGVLVLCSSQLPVGTIRCLETEWKAASGGRHASFACSPENLRLGRAIDAFTNPDRVVVGVRDERSRARIAQLWAPITERLEVMSVESAEMTKHAINAFLAASVAFINEIATLCEQVGADAAEVERGLKSERRIGPRAYLSPGPAFAGGTLARDIVFLNDLGAAVGVGTPLLSGVRASNAAHGEWVARTLAAEFPSLEGRVIALWGLTYKPGTDTLRRSSAVELGRWLSGRGARVQAFDPAVSGLPTDLAECVALVGDATAATCGAHALVVATDWPQFRDVPAAGVISAMATPVVIDPTRLLVATYGGRADV